MTEIAVWVLIGLITAGAVIGITELVEAAADWLGARRPHRRP